MPDFDQLLEICRNNSMISEKVIDQFLIYYAAAQDKVDREFDKRIARYRHIIGDMPPGWKGQVKTQYIARAIFGKNGLLKKYLKHAAIGMRDAEDREFLERSSQTPWRFTFSEVVANPAKDFYEMEDVFTAETYLLYSPSMTTILAEHQVILWFLLIGFNGDCWQTFGPLVNFKGLDPDDIFFYSLEVNPEIGSDEDLVEDIDRNPVRYMVLFAGGNYPLLMMRDHEIVQNYSEIDVKDFDYQDIKKNFKIEYADSVFRLTHEKWGQVPYYGEIYYKEGEKIIVSALTDQGYRELAKILRAQKIDVPMEADIRVHQTMLALIETLINRHIDLSPYSKRFEKKKSASEEEMLTKINRFSNLVLTYVNAGKKPDIDALAAQADIDPVTARDLYENLMESFRKMQKRR